MNLYHLELTYHLLIVSYSTGYDPPTGERSSGHLTDAISRTVVNEFLFLECIYIHVSYRAKIRDNERCTLRLHCSERPPSFRLVFQSALCSGYTSIFSSTGMLAASVSYVLFCGQVRIPFPRGMARSTLSADLLAVFVGRTPRLPPWFHWSCAFQPSACHRKSGLLLNGQNRAFLERSVAEVYYFHDIRHVGVRAESQAT